MEMICKTKFLLLCLLELSALSVLNARPCRSGYCNGGRRTFRYGGKIMSGCPFQDKNIQENAVCTRNGNTVPSRAQGVVTYGNRVDNLPNKLFCYGPDPHLSRYSGRNIYHRAPIICRPLDQHAPQAHCPPDVTLNIPQSSKQTELQFSANCSDNSGEIIKPNCTRQQNGEFLSLDNNLETVTCTCTDKSSNFDQCNFTVGVIDQHAPQAHCPPDVTLNIPPSSKQTELQFSANCSDNSGEIIKPNCTRQQNGEFLSLDNNLETVTCTCTDKSSNFDQCDFTVGVIDQHAPQAHCPPDVTLNIPPSSKQTELQFSANCSDNSGEIIKPNCTRQQNGEFLSLDNNLETVACTCTDKSSNFDQCDFTVGVIDQHAPQAHCPPDVTLNIPQSSKQTELQFSANCSDNSGEIIKPNCTRQQNGEFLSLDNNFETVACTCTDKSSNFDQCNFTVGVIDQHAPQAHCPPDVTLNIPPSSKQTELQFSANCSDNSGEIIKPNCTRQQNGEFLSLDNNLETVTCTCTDKSFNFDQCDFTVGVIDQHAPQAHCPPEVTLYIPQSSKQTELQFSANCSDNSGEIIKPNCTRQQNGEFLSLDNNLETVTCTCTDKSSNFDQCDFTVGVIDQHAPQAHCPPDLTLNIPQSSKQTELQFSANCSDNSGEIIKPNCTRQQNGEFLSLDNNLETVTCTCTDKSFNFDQCDFTVGVIDQHAPQAHCPPEVTLYIPQSSKQTELQFSANCSDNSGEIIKPNCTRQQNGEFLSLDNNLETVTCTCTDKSSNFDQCDFTVGVRGKYLVFP
ncbi:Hyalin [Holothuria leucospilota]|uniref:Hyalin n=1 Tax=Holothuria leucospilota TaxID=206669 RepID=A0A9Q1HKV6_HOLLE|nr:Hyalin [Holothuria leucospilota]